MPPSHAVTTRAPTADEAKTVQGLRGRQWASYGCMALLLGITPIWLLGALGDWVGGFVSADGAGVGRWAGRAAGLLVLAYWMTLFARFERGDRARRDRDAAKPAVEEIEVRDPQVVEIALINDNAPTLAFDIGQGKLLFLQGQWLTNPATFDAPSPEDDEGDEFLNGLPAPHSFPATRFTLTRLPHSGRVLGIRIAGAYLAPVKQVDALRPEYEFRDSEVLDGPLDRIAEVLKKTHGRRAAEDTVDKGRKPREARDR